MSRAVNVGRGSAFAVPFILKSTALASPPLLPEISLHLASEVTSLWHATEAHLSEQGIEPPFWAFAWAGGQALGRYLLDRPELVRGLSVLDFACGSGLCAIAAARAGAARVVAVDRDPLAVEAALVNAHANGVDIEARCADPCADPEPGAWLADHDVILAGDVCYDRAMAPAVVAWLRARAREGARVYLGDPGRAYLPEDGLSALERYRVPTPDGTEAREEMCGVVYRVG